MSEPEDVLDTDPDPQVEESVEPPRPARGGRWLALFAVLLALTALGGVGYLYYLTVYLDPRVGIDERFSALRSEQQAALSGQRRALEQTLEQEIAALRRDVQAQQEARLESEEALARSINEGMRLSPPSSREWKVAEVEYLLRIANHRLLMERDAVAAAKLLAAADEVLAGLDDYSLYPVRAQLAAERLALGNVEEIDVQGAFLRFEAIKATLNQLPLQLPQYLAERRGQVEPDAQRSFGQAFLDRLGSFVEFRRYPEGGLRPLLSPDQATYLEMNLRLMLERAQLAVLRGDAVLYEHSVAAALTWLDDYLDHQSAAVIEVRAELQSLQTLRLNRELPDISGSLANLRSLARYGIEDDEALP
jgi:uroporphyrin-3 C-methyltransferase